MTSTLLFDNEGRLTVDTVRQQLDGRPPIEFTSQLDHVRRC